MNKLNLGCGRKKIEGWINIDCQARVNPDKVWDIANLGLGPWRDSSIAEIKAMDFLEHIPIGKTIFVMEEIWRVLVNNGRFESFTPSTRGSGAFCDPTHLSFWNALSFRYFMDDQHRELYDIKAKFRGNISEFESNPNLNVWHIHAILFAVK